MLLESVLAMSNVFSPSPKRISLLVIEESLTSTLSLPSPISTDRFSAVEFAIFTASFPSSSFMTESDIFSFKFMTSPPLPVSKVLPLTVEPFSILIVSVPSWVEIFEFSKVAPAFTLSVSLSVKFDIGICGSFSLPKWILPPLKVTPSFRSRASSPAFI